MTYYVCDKARMATMGKRSSHRIKADRASWCENAPLLPALNRLIFRSIDISDANIAFILINNKLAKYVLVIVYAAQIRAWWARLHIPTSKDTIFSFDTDEPVRLSNFSHSFEAILL